ncbi:MAG: hypothetical protein NVSMB43_17400 [Pseudarthrobacter sp.]
MDTVVDHLRREEEIGYEAAKEAADRMEGVYSSVARLIGAGLNEIARAESGSRAWAMAVYSVPFVPRAPLLIGRTAAGRAFRRSDRRRGP